MPRIPGLLERIQQPLYDRGSILSTSTQLNFFQVPLGGGTTAKTELDPLIWIRAVVYPTRRTFELHAIRLINAYGVPVADAAAIYDGAWFRLFIGTKNYLVVNAFMLTAGVGLNGLANDIGTGGQAVSVVNGRGDQRGIYVLAEPIDLIPQQNFRCELNLPTALTLTSGATGGTNMSVYLDGFFKREVH